MTDLVVPAAVRPVMVLAEMTLDIADLVDGARRVVLAINSTLPMAKTRQGRIITGLVRITRTWLDPFTIRETKPDVRLAPITRIAPIIGATRA